MQMKKTFSLSKRNRQKKFVNNRPWEGYLFLLPWIIGLLTFTIFPMIASLYFSFTDFDGIKLTEWVGFDNYQKMFSDKRFIQSLKVTTKYVFISVPLQLIMALLVAVVLRKDRPGARLYRAIYYLPSLFGGSVAISLLWRRMFNKEGYINQILSLIGIEGKNWISRPETALNTLILLAIWQFGSSMVVFLGGLKQIDFNLYEAAKIDGASKIQNFFYITLPLLTPMVFFNVIMTVINAYQSFTPAYIVSGGTGAPADSTLFYSLYLYIKGFRQFSMAYASAMAWVLLLIVGFITIIMFAFSKHWVFYND